MVARSRWAVLALMFFIGVAVPMQFQAVAALAPYLIADIGLTYGDVGLMTGLFMAPGVLLSLPGGMLVNRFGDGASMLTGLALMLAGGLLVASDAGYPLMVLGRLLAGAGAVLITILQSKIVTDWFIGREIATALAIIAASFGFGVGIAMAVLPPLAEQVGWRWALALDAGLPALGMLLFWFTYRAPGDAVAAGMPGRLWRIDMREAALTVLAGVARGGFSTGYVVFMAFVPAVLITRGMSVAGAGFLTSLTAAVSILSVPLGGHLSDRSGRPGLFIVFGALGAGCACLALPHLAPALLWIGAFGLLRGGCTGGIMAMPAQVLRPEARATGFAVSTMLYFVLMTAFPPLAGLALDLTVNTSTPLYIAACLWFVIPPTLWLFTGLRRRWID